jgi:esterase FrsA
VNDLSELKQYVIAHAVSQQLPADHYAAVLDAIVTDEGDAPGSWAYEWIRAGDELRVTGNLLGASQYYTMGRFPHVDGPGRARALRNAVEAVEGWARNDGGIERRTVLIEGERVNLWTIGMSADRPRPLLVLTGGIVSPKEQWAAVLPQISGLGLAGVVAEYPGVGENPLRAHAASWRFFPALLDALSGEADVRETYLLALSFSGHLALRAAGHDPRIRGVVGNGPPLRSFFTDRAWQDQVPTITRDTLAHLADVDPAKVYEHIRDWALAPEELSALDIPVAAVVAGRDEIIPAADVELLRSTVTDLRLLEHDDVHGAPSHLARTRIWSLLAVLDMWPGADPAARSALNAALAVAGRSRGVS